MLNLVDIINWYSYQLFLSSFLIFCFHHYFKVKFIFIVLVSNETNCQILVVFYWLHALAADFLSSKVGVEAVLDYQLLFKRLKHFGETVILLACLDDLTR